MNSANCELSQSGGIYQGSTLFRIVEVPLLQDTLTYMGIRKGGEKADEKLGFDFSLFSGMFGRGARKC